MAIQSRLIEYTHEGEVLEAFMAWDEMQAEPRPAVMVSHAFRGREEFECGRAEELARMGYVGFALDLFGKDVIAETTEQAFELMNRFTNDRGLLHRRLAACVEIAQGQPEIDERRMAAIGYCFGGLCVLDMARTDLPLAGVCSFHGILSPPDKPTGKAIRAKVLVEHGWDDPMVQPDQVVAFAEEMNKAGADWQLHAHGGAMHAFTSPGANDADFGTVYHEAADRRSWQSLTNFLEELFSER
jgi:dienelactone hydrolase